MLTYLGFNPRGAIRSGLSYPALGLAHLLATVGVSVWATRLGGHAPLVLPAAFLLAMSMGLVLAVEEVPLLLFVEPMVWASGLALVYAAALAVRLSMTEIIGLVVLFGLYHGHALGGELASAGNLPVG
ncbi:HupE/UreJ family protein [Rubellimicrobium roseum]|uniref:HupE/UreJ family protein n=1 Tax=Rubellimicrobium roseum TaxID=687525 RepID=UPI00159BCF8C|nr:HupE/UreJ family protein [Rubellimicrobium roseum]